jgi:hypothetical protein
MKNSFKLKVTVTLETKTDETYSSWRDAFTKVSEETLVLDSETATIESLQKVIKANVSDVLFKTQNFIDAGTLLSKTKEEDPFTL